MGAILLGLNIDQIKSNNLKSTLVVNPRSLGIDKLIAYLCGLVFTKDSVSRLSRNQFDEHAQLGKVIDLLGHIDRPDSRPTPQIQYTRRVVWIYVDGGCVQLSTSCNFHDFVVNVHAILLFLRNFAVSLRIG